MQTDLTSSRGIGWRVPNSVFISLSIIVVVLTWTLLIVAYPSLPSRIPSHFGFAGFPDATMTRSVWSVFLPAIVQSVFVALTWWLSHHPDWSNLPTGVTIRILPEPTKGIVRKLLAHMLVMTGLIASLIMAYVSLGIVRVGLGLTDRLQTWVILALGTLLLLIIAVYTGWLVKLTRHLPRTIVSAPSSDVHTDTPK